MTGKMHRRPEPGVVDTVRATLRTDDVIPRCNPMGAG